MSHVFSVSLLGPVEIMYNVDGQLEHFKFYSTLNITQDTSFQVELPFVRVTLQLTVSQSVSQYV
jgi:hypothetical protein